MKPGRYARRFSLGFLLLSLLASPVYADDLRARLEARRSEHALPALAAAIIDSGGVRVEVVGRRKHSDPRPALSSDRFHLGSCTKAMTATLLATLVQEGRLRWTTTLGELFPDLAMDAAYRSVSVCHLLSHRGGLPKHSWPPGMSFGDVHALSGGPRRQRRAYLEAMLLAPPVASPGSRFVYSNAGFAIAGAIAERLLGRPYEALMAERVFEPLGITSFGFGAMGRPGAIDQPWQHRRLANGVRAIEPGPRSDNPPAIAPAGTVHMSIGDWARFVAAHLAGARGAGGLLRPDSWRRLHEPCFGGSYALGWQRVKRAWGGGQVLTHAGSNTMNTAVVWMAPSRGFAVLVATNIAGEGVRGACDAVVGDLIEGIRRGRSTPRPRLY